MATSIALFVGLMVVVWIWFWIQAQIGAAGNRLLLRGTHKQGQAEVRRKVEFGAPVPAEQLLDSILARINARAEAPPLIGGIYLGARVGPQARIDFGSKMADSFSTVIKLTDVEGGSRGTVEVSNWNETGGLVDGIKEMALIRTRTVEAVEAAGGWAREADGQQVAA